MSNITVTTVDTNRGPGFGDPVYENNTFEATGAIDLVKGTILARDSVSGNLVPFVVGGSSNENGIPKAVLAADLSFTGAGTQLIRPLVKGQVAGGRLVIQADGDNSNVDAVVKDQLRDFGIIVRDSEERLALEP